MMKTLVAMSLALAALHASAAPATGAPGSAACSKALEQLRELEDRMLNAPRERAEALRKQMLLSRRAAALACLGESSADDTAPRPPRVEAPTAPPRDATPPVALPLRLPSTMTPSRVAPPALPRTLSSCDVNGCWTNDGIRLQRVGPQLLGPRGVCSTAGNVVQCP